jgi:hypothetical protein
VGAANPYVGRRVLAAVWRHGYMLMLRDMLNASPARQATRPSTRPAGRSESEASGAASNAGAKVDPANCSSVVGVVFSGAQLCLEKAYE